MRMDTTLYSSKTDYVSMSYFFISDDQDGPRVRGEVN